MPDDIEESPLLICPRAAVALFRRNDALMEDDSVSDADRQRIRARLLELIDELELMMERQQNNQVTEAALVSFCEDVISEAKSIR